jgi:rubrerythrin
LENLRPGISTYFSSAARKEGYEQIAAIFLETAENEKEHAKLFFNLLKGGETEIVAAYPAGKVGTTAENLKAAAAGENLEWTTLYQDFAKIAKKEGFQDAFETFLQIAKVEKAHDERYLTLLKNVTQEKVFKKNASTKWHCRNCGYVFEGKEVPDNVLCVNTRRPSSKSWQRIMSLIGREGRQSFPSTGLHASHSSCAECLSQQHLTWADEMYRWTDEKGCCHRRSFRYPQYLDRVRKSDAQKLPVRKTPSVGSKEDRVQQYLDEFDRRLRKKVRKVPELEETGVHRRTFKD